MTSLQACLQILAIYSYLKKAFALLMVHKRYVLFVQGRGWTEIVLTSFVIVFIIGLLLTCGDVEPNPGPLNGETTNEGVEQTLIMLDRKMDQQTAVMDGKLDRLLESFTASQNLSVQLESRLVSLERTIKAQTTQVQDQLSRLLDKVSFLDKNARETENIISTLQEDQEHLHSRLEDLEHKLERQDRNSKRLNVLIYGVKEDYTENYDLLPKVISILQKYFPHNHWEDNIVETVHRLGSRSSVSDRPRPVIVKFYRLGDVMAVMRDRDGRSKLRDEKGFNIVADLTQQQRSTVKQLRQQGKHAYYANGKLVVKDFRLNHRQTAESFFPRLPDRPPPHSLTDSVHVSTDEKNSSFSRKENFPEDEPSRPINRTPRADQDDDREHDHEQPGHLNPAEHRSAETETAKTLSDNTMGRISEFSPSELEDRVGDTPPRPRGMGRGRTANSPQQSPSAGRGGKRGGHGSRAVSPTQRTPASRMTTRSCSQSAEPSSSTSRQSTIPEDWRCPSADWR